MPAARRPRLVVVTGRPGTGKTTVASALAAELAAVYLRIDAIETALQAARGDDGPVGVEGYVVAHYLAASNLRLGQDVIIDAVCPVPESRTGWSGTVADAGASLIIFETALADRDEHRRRVCQRRPDLDGQRVPSWQQVEASEWVPWNEQRDGPRVVIDTSAHEDARAAALRQLAQTI